MVDIVALDPFVGRMREGARTPNATACFAWVSGELMATGQRAGCAGCAGCTNCNRRRESNAMPVKLGSIDGSIVSASFGSPSCFAICLQTSKPASKQAKQIASASPRARSSNQKRDHTANTLPLASSRHPIGSASYLMSCYRAPSCSLSGRLPLCAVDSTLV